MSFREKTAWIAVLLTLPVWGHYFFRAWASYADRTLGGDDGLLQLFAVSFGASVVLLLGINLASARLGRHRFGADPDERERQIEARARSVEAGMLQLGALAIAAAAPWLSGSIAAGFPHDPPAVIGVAFANLILLAVLVSQVLHELAIIAQFRMMD